MTKDTQEIRDKIKEIIVRSLDLELRPQDIADNALLFDESGKGGLELDSLAALEIIVAVCKHFKILATEVDDPNVLQNVATLADFVEDKLRKQASEVDTAIQ
jgi:acyl carrier protein